MARVQVSAEASAATSGLAWAVASAEASGAASG